jgi:ABC-2 type transport system ATP-binding protein
MVDVIRVEHVTKRFALRKVKSLKESVFAVARGQANSERFTALDDVSIEIAAGESVGLVGPTGPASPPCSS